jgi:hypothetical protein
MQLKRLFVSCVVAAIISCIVFVVLTDFGVTWDEPEYISRADQYISWLINPRYSDKDRVFAVNGSDIHPPLRILLGGVTHELLVNRLHVINTTRGYRISSLLFVFPLMLVFTYIAIGQFGYGVGTLTAFMFSLLPQVLFLTAIFTIDYAVAALWFLAVVFGMKGMKNYFWLMLSAVSMGCALLTKFHGYLIFVPVVGFWAWYFRKPLLKFQKNKALFGAIVKLLFFISITVAVYIIGWPWLWSSTIAHLGVYFHYQLIHYNIPVYIFGRLYAAGPWWYATVMFFTTTPAFTILFLLIGSIYAVRKGSVWDRVILLNALYPIVFFSLPRVYSYDWIRLFLAAYPFACLIAGRGIIVAVSWLKSKMRWVGAAIIVMLWLVTVYSSVIRIHPWESAYYNEFVGGIKGASRLGFESEFWGNSYLGVVPWMNMYKRDMMCVWPNYQPFSYYLAMGQLQAGVVFDAKGDACKYLVVLMRQGFFFRDPYMAKIVASQKPVYTVSVDGVTLVGVYDKTLIK